MSNNQVDTSEDEDYKNFLEKYNKKSDYGKSQDEIIWEAICRSDPKFVEEIEAKYKALEDHYEGMIFYFYTS